MSKRLLRRDFIRAGLAAAAYGACNPSWGRQSDNGRQTESSPAGWSQLPAILASIVPPKFPDRDFLITDYGARDLAGADSAPALNAAIQACNQSGGGRVVVPAGNWLSNGPIRLLSKVNLYLDKDAAVTFGTDPSVYLPVVLVRWQGVRCYNYSPLIHAHGQKDFAVTGAGSFNGRGYTWSSWTDKSKEDWTVLQNMGRHGVPVSDRLFGPGHYLRPAMFEAYDCQNILIDGVTFEGSPFWTMHPTFCTNVTIRNVTVLPGGENDDGCDPDSCLNVLVAGCSFTTVDDNVSVKAGLNPDAKDLPSCENIVIQNCNCLRSVWSGLTIGTQVGGYVRNVFIENCAVGNCQGAHFIKARANWGGGVENVYIRSNRVSTCENLLLLEPDSLDFPGTGGPPVFSNINMQDVTCADSTGAAFDFAGDPRLPIDAVNLSTITVKHAKQPAEISNTNRLTAKNIRVNGEQIDLTA
jgi:polygalacturonase